MNPNYREKLKEITTFIFDFDGVLSDGKIYVLSDGEQIRSTNVKDGYAMQYALKKGFRIAIISGGVSETIRLRYQRFAEMDIYIRVANKVPVFQEFIKKYNLKESEVLYMGDDLPDYKLMKLVGLSCCPADACEEIKQIAETVKYKIAIWFWCGSIINKTASRQASTAPVSEQTTRVLWFDFAITFALSV